MSDWTRLIRDVGRVAQQLGDLSGDVTGDDSHKDAGRSARDVSRDVSGASSDLSRATRELANGDLVGAIRAGLRAAGHGVDAAKEGMEARDRAGDVARDDQTARATRTNEWDPAVGEVMWTGADPRADTPERRFVREFDPYESRARATPRNEDTDIRNNRGNAGNEAPARPPADEPRTTQPATEPAEVALSASATGDDMQTRAVQAYLEIGGFEPGPLDGEAGGLTRAAIERYSESLGVTIDPHDLDTALEVLRRDENIQQRIDDIVAQGTDANRQQAEAVQTALTSEGHDTKGVDGAIGPNTRTAHASYREEFGAPAQDNSAPAIQPLVAEAEMTAPPGDFALGERGAIAPYATDLNDRVGGAGFDFATAEGQVARSNGTAIGVQRADGTVTPGDAPDNAPATVEPPRSDGPEILSV